jgi:hypothetical protein
MSGIGSALPGDHRGDLCGLLILGKTGPARLRGMTKKRFKVLDAFSVRL